ncbi:MAG: hypothetical protein AAF645_26220 [Myxococcota bacterium]
MRVARLFLVLLLSLPALAHAQQGFRRTVREALSEFQAGHWAEARTLFLRAHEIRPSAEALRMAGNASYEMRDYVRAVELLEASMVQQENPLSDESVALAEEASAAAERFVVRLTINTRHPNVRVNERSVDPSQPILLERGEHLVEVQGEGFEAYRERIEMAEALHRLDVQLRPLVMSDDVAAPEPEPQLLEEESGSRRGLWIALGIVGAVVVAGAVVGVVVATSDSGPPFGANAPNRVVEVLGVR